MKLGFRRQSVEGEREGGGESAGLAKDPGGSVWRRRSAGWLTPASSPAASRQAVARLPSAPDGGCCSFSCSVSSSRPTCTRANLGLKHRPICGTGLLRLGCEGRAVSSASGRTETDASIAAILVGVRHRYLQTERASMAGGSRRRRRRREQPPQPAAPAAAPASLGIRSACSPLPFSLASLVFSIQA